MYKYHSTLQTGVDRIHHVLETRIYLREVF
jgi:hypothetical protein